MIRHLTKFSLAGLALALCVNTASAQPFAAPDPDLTGAFVQITLSGKIIAVDETNADPSTRDTAKPKFTATRNGKDKSKQLVLGRLDWDETTGQYNVTVLSENPGGVIITTPMSGYVRPLAGDAKGKLDVQYNISIYQDDNADDAMDQLSTIAGFGTLNVNPNKVGDPEAGINEVQTIDVSAATVSFDLSFGGETTAPINLPTDAATVQANLVLLASIGTGNVAVTGNDTDGYSVEFTGDLANMNVEELTSGNADVVIATQTEGATGFLPVGGSIKVDKTGQVWSGMDYGAPNINVWGSPKVSMKFIRNKFPKPYNEL